MSADTAPEEVATTRHPVAGWARRLDPLTGLWFVAALVVFCLHGFDGKLTRDLAFYAYAGQAFADGVPPYEGVFNQAGPLAHMIPALGVWLARLGGFDELLGMRLVFALIAAACVSTAHVVGRDAFRSRPAGIAAAAAMTSFAGFIDLASNGPREKTPMVLFMLFAVWAAARHDWLAAGVFVSLSTLVLQVAFFVAAPVVVATAVVATRGRDRIGSLLRFLAGGAAVAATALAYLAVVGALRRAVDGFLLVNLKYTTAVHPDFDRIWRSLTAGFGLSRWCVVIGLLGTWMLLVTDLLKRSAADRARIGILTGLAFGALCGVVWDFQDFDHWQDLLPLLPIAAVGVGGLVDAVVRQVPERGAVAGTAVVCLGLVSIGLGYSMSDRHHELDDQRASVDVMTRILGKDVSVLSIQAPQPLVLMRKRNPSPHQLFFAGLDKYVDDHWPGGLADYQQWILREHPTLIAIGEPRTRRWIAALEDGYRFVACAPGWKWFAARSLDDETIAALAEAGRDSCRR